MVVNRQNEGGGSSKAWQVDEIPTPQNIRVTESGAGLTDFPPEMEAIVFRDDHSDGMVKSRIVTNENDYYSGDVHSSIRNKVIKPPSVDEITLPTSEATSHIFLRFGINLYVSDGRYLHRSSNGTTFTQVLDTGSGNEITDLKPFDTYILVANKVTSSGNANDYYYSTNGSSFTQRDGTGTPQQVHYFFTRDDTLFGLENPNSMYSATDPANGGTWSGATEIGDTSAHFHWGLVVANTLVIGKSDRVYTVDSSSNVSTLIAQFAENPGHQNFGAVAAAFNSNLYTTVDEEVWEYDPVSGNLRPIGLTKLPDFLLQAGGDHEDGVAYDGTALYAIHHTSLSNTTSIVRVTQDTDFDFKFERWMTTTSSGYEPQGGLYYTTLFTRKTGRALYLSTSNAGTIAVMNLPRSFDPTLDSASEFSLEDNTYRSGWMAHNFPSRQKDYTSVTVDLVGLTGVPPKTTVDIYYYVDGDETTRYTLKENITSSGLERLEFSDGLTARSFMLEIIFKTDNVKVTPEMLSWTVSASVKFEQREIITAAVRVGDGIKNRSGNKSAYNARDIRNISRSLREAANVTVRYQDYRGYDFSNVRILPPFSEVDSQDENKGANETMMTLRFMRVSEDTSNIFTIGPSAITGIDVIGP